MIFCLALAGRQTIWCFVLQTDCLGIRPRKKAMLVLSRSKNESIIINDDITIVVVDIRGDKVRLGIEAPKEVPVHRREVFDAIRRNESVHKEGESKSE